MPQRLSLLNVIIYVNCMYSHYLLDLLCMYVMNLHTNNGFRSISRNSFTSRKRLRIKVTPDLHLTYSKNGENLGLVLKMKIIACISILLPKHVKYPYLYLFKFILYSIVTFKAN